MNIEIANRLLELRKGKKFSQEELAEKIGVSRQAVSKWERAESSPDTDNLIELARLYEVSLDELLFTTEPIPRKDENVANEECDGGVHAKEKDNTVVYTALKGFWQISAYSVAVTVVYLIMGFFGRLWHPGWLVFLTIPIYSIWVIERLTRKHKKNNSR